MEILVRDPAGYVITIGTPEGPPRSTALDNSMKEAATSRPP